MCASSLPLISISPLDIATMVQLSDRSKVRIKIGKSYAKEYGLERTVEGNGIRKHSKTKNKSKSKKKIKETTATIPSNPIFNEDSKPMVLGMNIA